MKILIATDGSEFSKTAVEKACELITKPSETEVTILSVYEPPTIATEPFVPARDYFQVVCESAQALSESNVEKARAMISSRVSTVSIKEVVAMGTPAQTIVEIAEQSQPDLIVMGSHGRGFWSRALLGSVSDSVVRHAPCSVLIVRKKETGSNAEIR